MIRAHVTRTWHGDRVRREIRKATAAALTETARKAEQHVKLQLPKVFDRPTPFTQRAPAHARARETENPIEARVYIRPIQREYLRLQVTGGTRRAGGSGLLVPRGARLNRYGNLPRGYLKRMLSRPDTFVGTVAGVRGLWQRAGRGRRRLKLLVAFERQATYRPHFDLRGLVTESVQRTYRQDFRAAFARILSRRR